MRIFYEPPNREELRHVFGTKSPTKTHTVWRANQTECAAHKSFLISNPMTDPNAAPSATYLKCTKKSWKLLSLWLFTVGFKIDAVLS